MDDLISRQAAIDVADAVWSVTGDTNVAKVWDQIKDLPSAQPEITEDDVKEFCRKKCLIVVTSDFYDEMIRRWASAQPERKKGHWIEYDNSHCECPVCHEEWSYFDDEPDRFNFCPNCGADMREREEE